MVVSPNFQALYSTKNFLMTYFAAKKTLFFHTAITCASLDPVGNGSIAYSPNISEPFDFDTVATHTCNEAYYLEGIGIRTCVGDGSSTTGQWSGAAPVCLGNSV